MQKKPRPGQNWWGRFDLPEGQAGLWRIGPATFWIERLQHEWRVAYAAPDETAEDSLEVVFPLPIPEKHDLEMTVSRFGMSKTSGALIVTPALADRPVVIRPELPFYILPKQDVTLYVSSPLWIRMETGKPPVALKDMPIYRPSDTWFGPSTMEGELAYAAKVRARLRLEEIRFRPHRAVTVVLLRNRRGESVFLERLNLPVPNLSLYGSADGNLWTQPVTLEMGANNRAGLELEEVAPAQAKNPQLICGPRQKAGKNILSKALNYLIG